MTVDFEIPTVDDQSRTLDGLEVVGYWPKGDALFARASSGEIICMSRQWVREVNAALEMKVAK